MGHDRRWRPPGVPLPLIRAQRDRVTVSTRPKTRDSTWSGASRCRSVLAATSTRVSGCRKRNGAGSATATVGRRPTSATEPPRTRDPRVSPSSGASCRTVQLRPAPPAIAPVPRSPSGSRPASPIPRNPSAATTTRTSIAPRTNDSTPTAITSRRSPGSPQAVPKPSTTSGSGRVSGSGRRPLLA
jgi:hypothetical protein